MNLTNPPSLECHSQTFLNSGFITFPIAFRGRLSITRSTFGILYGDIRDSHQLYNSEYANSCPDFNTTNAVTASPHVSSSTPITAHSAMLS